MCGPGCSTAVPSTPMPTATPSTATPSSATPSTAAPTPTQTQPPTPRCVFLSRTTIPQGSIKPLKLACLCSPTWTPTPAPTHGCVLSMWQSWAPCTGNVLLHVLAPHTFEATICCAATCGGGESRRYRSIEIAPLGPGVPDCPSTAETKDCNFQVRSILDTAALLMEAYAADSAGLPGELYDLSMDELAAVFGELRWSRHNNN